MALLEQRPELAQWQQEKGFASSPLARVGVNHTQKCQQYGKNILQDNLSHKAA